MRPTLITTVSGFMAANSWAPIMPRVCAVSGVATTR